ncbi:MAG TPA: hypothetical protein DEB25_06330 [Desulfobulbaceae bacterium]|nr:hypothetical protein [Desulfobulbaceae bacterium]
MPIETSLKAAARRARDGGALFRRTPGKDRQEGEERFRERENFLRCVRCGHIITHRGQAIAVAGGHEQTFVNPVGKVFTVRLFRRTPGCRWQGRPTREFSWFPGYLWRLALCGGCGDHLGWLFQGEDEFTALIAAAIAEK